MACWLSRTLAALALLAALSIGSVHAQIDQDAARQAVGVAPTQEEALRRLGRLLEPDLRFVGSCDSAIEGQDAGQLCIAFLNERGGIEAWSLGIFQSDATLTALLRWNRAGFVLVGIIDPPPLGESIDVGLPW